MTTHNHLNELIRRHRKVENELRVALLHPSVDQLEIRALKQQKLMLKDQIMKIERMAMGDRVMHGSMRASAA